MKYKSEIVLIMLAVILIPFSNAVATETTGSLKIITNPSEVNGYEKLWKLDGTSTYYESHHILYNLQPGNYTVLFKEFDGWEAPAPMTVKVEAGKLKIEDASYTLLQESYAQLQVCIDPDAAVQAGAKWCFYGESTWYGDGQYVTDLAPGDYKIIFKDVTGWESPNHIYFSLSAGEEKKIDVTYTSKSEEKGELKVKIEPEDARKAGAKWRLYGESTWYESGKCLCDLPAGTYYIEFKEISGWIQPQKKSVELKAGHEEVVEGEYKKSDSDTGWLKVYIDPDDAVKAGAKWRLKNGNDWYPSGHLLSELKPGDCIVVFKDIDGWETPGEKKVEIKAGHDVHVTGTYSEPWKPEKGSLKVIISPQKAAQAGALWKLDGTDDWHSSYQTIGDLETGKYWVIFREIDGWIPPDPEDVYVEKDERSVLEVKYVEKAKKLPKINWFKVEEEVIGIGGSTLLKWSVENADDISIDPEPGDNLSQEGRESVKPSENTTYTLTAENEHGTATAVVNVTVIKEPPTIHWFTSSHPEDKPLNAGETAMLNWKISGAARIEIDDFDVSPSQKYDPDEGNLEVKPKKTTLFKLTAFNKAGTSTAEATVFVTRLPVIDYFMALPGEIVTGDEAKLKWNVFDSDEIEISPDIGTFDESKGFKRVFPEENTTYTLVARNEYGESSATVEVKVVTSDQAPDLSISGEIKTASDSETFTTVVGERNQIKVRISNPGYGIASNVKICLADGSTVLAVSKIGTLKPGKSVHRELTFVLFKPGLHTLKLIVDPDNEIAEMDETNNEQFIKVNVQEVTGIDLVVGNVSVKSGPEGSAEGTYVLDFTIANVGNQDASGFQMTAYFAEKASGDDELFVFTTYINDLKAGGSQSFSKVVNLKDVKKFFLKIIADTENTIQESNEKNNRFLKKYRAVKLKSD